MGMFSFLGDIASSAVSSIKSIGTAVFTSAKKFIGKSIEFLATRAESLIESVKQTWGRMKPYVEQFRTFIQIAAKAALPFPWIHSVLMAVDKGIGALFAFENSPVAKKVEQALRWAIELAKRIKASNEQNTGKSESAILSEGELETAKNHQVNIRAAEEQLQASGQAHEIALLTAINDFEIAKADIEETINKAPSNFEHYLRLRATQKLLKIAEEKFRTATEFTQISADDIFMVRVASDLIKADPELSEQAAERLDGILQTRYGKQLTPFVFEEMIASWANSAEAQDMAWRTLNKTFVRDRMLEKNLSVAKRVQGELSAEEEATLQQLCTDIPKTKAELDQIETKKMDIDRYVGAAEGFLQLLEKSEEEIRNEGNEFLITDSPEIGELLMRCAEQHIPFNELSDDQQSLIRDYANIFKKASRERMANTLMVQA